MTVPSGKVQIGKRWVVASGNEQWLESKTCVLVGTLIHVAAAYVVFPNFETTTTTIIIIKMSTIQHLCVSGFPNSNLQHNSNDFPSHSL